MVILVTGGTGMIGQKLVKELRIEGHHVRILSRNPLGRQSHYAWYPDKGLLDESALENVEAIVHLAGAGIADHRWTSSYKSILESSRIDSARVLDAAIHRSGVRLKHVIGMSGAGYYGDRGNDILDENERHGNDYLAQLCVQWEDASRALGKNSENTSILRMGVVLHRNSSFVRKVSPFIRKYLGAPLGSGRQYVPWMHLDDVVQLIVSILEDRIPAGTYNAASPNVVTNTQMMHALAKTFNRKIILPPIPEFVLAILYGEMKLALLESTRLNASKLLATGFRFEKEKLHHALRR